LRSGCWSEAGWFSTWRRSLRKAAFWNRAETCWDGPDAPGTPEALGFAAGLGPGALDEDDGNGDGDGDGDGDGEAEAEGVGLVQMIGMQAAAWAGIAPPTSSAAAIDAAAAATVTRGRNGFVMEALNRRLSLSIV
jgi:hypothetical protein